MFTRDVSHQCDRITIVAVSLARRWMGSMDTILEGDHPRIFLMQIQFLFNPVVLRRGLSKDFKSAALLAILLKCQVIRYNSERGPSNEYYEKKKILQFSNQSEAMVVIVDVRQGQWIHKRSMGKTYMSFLPWKAKN